jgi:hypothetical protein
MAEYVRVQLFFEGGPWANQLLESEITQAPEFLAPDDEHPGVYRRTERPGSSAAVYEWVPDGSETSRRIPRPRVRIAFEVVGAVIALMLAIVTLISRTWIEDVFRFDPDRSSGVWEWTVVFALFAISIGLTLTARHEWRRLGAVA